jgi:ribonuclease HII
MTTPDLKHEQVLWGQGLTVVAGVDEVGRGAWAGPVVAAAAVFSPGMRLHAEGLSVAAGTVLPRLLRDSKKLSPAQRQKVAHELLQINMQWAIGEVGVDEISAMGIGPANFLAMQRALDRLTVQAEYVLIDGFLHPHIASSKQQQVIKGDATVASIAAASVLAKVHRDALMEGYAQRYPEYGFAQHKGYGTSFHQQAILQHGLTPIHRAGYNLKFLTSMS